MASARPVHGLRVLHVIRTLDPRGGGPQEGLRQYCAAAARMGHRFEVASLDAPGAEWEGEFPAVVHALGVRRGGYGYSAAAVPWLRTHAREYDAVVAHGLWQYQSLATWRALRGTGTPYLAFTHGMLDPWFKRAYPLKHLKKWLYWPWADYRVLRDAAAVLFTCEEERIQSARTFWLYRANPAVVGFGTAAPPEDAAAQREAFFRRFPALAGKRLFLFLGRIHPKKGCDLLIEAFAAAARADASLRLMVAGPDSTGLTPALQQRCRELGAADAVVWPGMLSGDEKWGAFRAAEAFALPSHQENFGVAVVEALACDTPVLISDKVNIWREIEADRAGLVAPDDLQGTSSLLARWLALDEAERAAYRARARPAFERRFGIETATAALVRAIDAVRRSGTEAVAAGTARTLSD